MIILEAEIYCKKKSGTHSPDIEEENGADSGRWKFRSWVLGRFSDGNVGTDVPQAKTATRSSDHQQLSSTVLINKEDKIDDCENGLDNTEQTSREERGVKSNNSDTLKHRWGVVVDGVDSGSVLPEEQRSSEEESPLNMSVGCKKPEWLPEAHAATCHLALNISINGIHFFFDIDIIFVKFSDPTEVLDCLLSSPLRHEPSG